VEAELDAGVALEALPCAGQHRLGGVEADRLGFGMRGAKERDQAPIAGPQVEEAVYPHGERLEEHRLRRLAVGDLPREVLGDACGV
jgi:hypothetical protein